MRFRSFSPLLLTLLPMASTPLRAQAIAAPASQENPLLGAWDGAFGEVPFDAIRVEDFPAAFDAAMAQQKAAIAAITASTETPDAGNTLAALERSGALLQRVADVFDYFSSNLASDAVQTIESDYAGRMAKHRTDILLDPTLFERVRSVHQRADELRLDPETRRLAEVTYTAFVRAGATLAPEVRARVAALTQREAELQTRFGQNLLKDTDSFVMLLDEEDLDGLPPAVRAGAAEAARMRGHEGRYAFTLQRPSVEDFLTYASRRDLRERIFRAFNDRGGNGNEYDNRGIVQELVSLRAERAELLGHPSHAAYITEDSMAKSPEAVLELLRRVWRPALEQARAERARLQQLVQESGANHELAGWDWRYYAERLRQEEYDLDPAELQPYMQLESLRAAAFHVAGRLFHIQFQERTDVPRPHADVRVFEVRRTDGAHVGLLYCDDFARPGKRSGAWMSSLRAQSRLDGSVTPHVTNNLNLAKPPAGARATISVTEAETLFHELGHALHGLLSDVHYPSLSGTNVPRDYVEFMAQFMEHYVTQPQVLDHFARHAATGEPMPAALRERFIAASRFNQGFATCEYLASALVDQMFHALDREAAADIDPVAFEAAAMKEIGALEEIPMRHRTLHFAHIFAGGYSAGYYSYLWSEVLDADGFAAFEEAGDIYDATTAAKLLAQVFSRGNTLDWMTGYIAFRGAPPSVDALLRDRGLAD
jgi:peptidyl-dipeptidase Dcp